MERDPYFRGLLATLIVTAGCTDAARIPDAKRLLGPGTKTLVLEVDYMTGAEPLTGPLVSGPFRDHGDTWNLVETNLRELVRRPVVVPHTLAAMQSIGPATQETYTPEELRALAEAHADLPLASGESALYVLFVDGTLADANGPRPDVLAATLRPLAIVAIFVPHVRAAAANATGAVRAEILARFTEQTSLIHEFGHALGLVNHEAPLATPHEDIDHHFHCVNRACVMFWLNEGAQELVQFVQTYVDSPDRIVFDDACLDDVEGLVNAL